jgi:1,4-dihydroxy-2-naphthoate polyprenyltransferase
MTTARQWVAAARPPTLPASLVPVAIGTAVARAAGPVSVWRVVCCFVVALALQIGTNYANDYADGVRGTDAKRTGPVRLVAAGLASPKAVRLAAFIAFGISAAVGLVVAITTNPWLIVVGAASIAAGYFYTGGPRPYGYAGLGELFVFVFFGGVAVCGTTYVASGSLPAAAYIAAIPVGLLSVALLVVNNLRDIPGDTASGKRTLAVRLGAERTRALYLACFLVALLSTVALVPMRSLAVIGCVGLIFGVLPIRRVLGGARGPDLVPALIETGRVQLAFGALLALGIAL